MGGNSGNGAGNTCLLVYIKLLSPQCHNAFCKDNVFFFVGVVLIHSQLVQAVALTCVLGILDTTCSSILKIVFYVLVIQLIIIQQKLVSFLCDCTKKYSKSTLKSIPSADLLG